VNESSPISARDKYAITGDSRRDCPDGFSSTTGGPGWRELGMLLGSILLVVAEIIVVRTWTGPCQSTTRRARAHGTPDSGRRRVFVRDESAPAPSQQGAQRRPQLNQNHPNCYRFFNVAMALNLIRSAKTGCDWTDHELLAYDITVSSLPPSD